MEEALGGGITTIIGGGTGPAEGQQGHHGHAGRLASRPHVGGARPLALERRAAGQGQHDQARLDARAIAFRCFGFQAARGLGFDSRRDRRMPACRGRVRSPGRAAHRHPQRARFRRGHRRRHRRPRHPRLPHRGCGWRACPGHRHRRLPTQRAAEFDQSDPSAHGQHPRRTPRHADGVPPPQPQRPRGPCLRREPDPAVDDRRRGPLARHRCDFDDRQRRPGDGSDRRGGHADVADRAHDEEAPRRAARATVPPTTTGFAATSRSTRSTRRSRTVSTTRSDPSRSASWPIWCCGTRRSSAFVRTW